VRDDEYKQPALAGHRLTVEIPKDNSIKACIKIKRVLVSFLVNMSLQIAHHNLVKRSNISPKPITIHPKKQAHLTTLGHSSHDSNPFYSR